MMDSGWIHFCKMVLEQVKWTRGMSLVVDGIRHLEAFETLKELTQPTKAFLVFVAVDSDTQSRRPEERSHRSPDDTVATEPLVTDLEISRVECSADIKLDGNKSIDLILERILSSICIVNSLLQKKPSISESPTRPRGGARPKPWRADAISHPEHGS
jgi:hypothetical protein